jgi:uncharacterized protein YjbJ (UPF0337 family)
MSDKQYPKQQLETAEATFLPFFGIAQQGLRATVDWQKFILDSAVRETVNLVELHKAVLDSTARQSSTFIGAAQQQFEQSINTFVNLTQRWLDDVTNIQNTLAGEVRRAVQATPVPRPPKISERGHRKPEWDRIEREWDKYKDKLHDRWRELPNEALESSHGNRDELARRLQQTYNLGKDEAYDQLDEFVDYVGAGSR